MNGGEQDSDRKDGNNSVDEVYRTAPRPKAARSGAVDPRPGEDDDRGGQKTHVSDPDGMKATDPRAGEARREDNEKLKNVRR